MLKICGAILIAAAGFFVIRIDRREYRNRQGELYRWIELLENMQGEIRWHHISLTGFLQEQALTSGIAKYMESKMPLQQAWEEITRDITDKDAGRILHNLQFTGDREKLLASLSFIAAQLRDLYACRREEASNIGKIRLAATFSGVGLLIILLL